MPRRSPGRAEVLRAFRASPELRALPRRDRELVWVEALLETMADSGWSWGELDAYALAAALFESFGWTIRRAPEDPARVARVLDAFVAFAARTYGAPHAPALRAYLGQPDTVAAIGRWVRPFSAAPERPRSRP